MEAFMKEDDCQGDTDSAVTNNIGDKKCGIRSKSRGSNNELTLNINSETNEIEELIDEGQKQQQQNENHSSRILGRRHMRRSLIEGNDRRGRGGGGVDEEEEVELEEEGRRMIVLDQEPSSSNCDSIAKHSIIIIYDFSKLMTPVGVAKIVIIVSCIVSLVCICATDYSTLVVSTQSRFHIFSLTFVLLTVLVVFLCEILTLLLLFPIHWAHFNAIVHFALCLLLNASSSLLIHSLFTHEAVMPRLDNTVEMLIISGVSGFFGALLCIMLTFMGCCCYDHHLTLPWKQHSDGVLMLK